MGSIMYMYKAFRTKAEAEAFCKKQGCGVLLDHTKQKYRMRSLFVLEGGDYNKYKYSVEWNKWV